VTRLTIQALSGLEDAIRLATKLGVQAHGIQVHTFPDGELLVSTGPVAPVTIVYAPLDRPNGKLVAILFAAEALRRNGAQRLILLAPYMCYMRQDAAFHPGEAISQHVVGNILAEAFDRIVTVDAHLHRTHNLEDVFHGIEADNLSAMPAIAVSLRTIDLDPATVLFGPDEESQRLVEDLGRRLGLARAVGQKTRRGDRSVEIKIAEPNLIAGRPILIVDDIVSSGGTLIACATSLTSAGAKTIDAIVTHALFPPELLDVFNASGIRSIRSTHSVPHPTNRIVLDDLFATALRKELGNDRSIGGAR
jgi:ribose-phosphate pyrophosphokinase